MDFIFVVKILSKKFLEVFFLKFEIQRKTEKISSFELKKNAGKFTFQKIKDSRLVIDK